MLAVTEMTIIGTAMTFFVPGGRALFVTLMFYVGLVWVSDKGLWL